MPSEHVDALARLATIVRHRERQVVLERGDEGTSLLAVIKGRLKVISTNPDGRESVLGFEGPGSVIGEISLLDGGPRSASVVALETTELLVLQRNDVLHYLRNNPDASLALLHVLASRLRRLSERSEDVAFRPIRARLAKRILQLVETYGSPQDGGVVRIGLKLSQQELGESIDATRESVNKHLRSFEADGFLTQEDGHILVRGVEALRAVACADA